MNQIIKPERIALIDMDGTVADYEGAMQKSYNEIAAPGEMTYWHASRQYGRDRWPDHLWARISLIQRQISWWRDLAKLDVGFEIISVLKHFNFNFHVATKGPSSKPQAWAEKVEWVREHMPYAEVHITEKKSLLYGKILVDDWPEFAIDWLKNRPRGLVVMPAHHYNQGISHPQILRYEIGMSVQLADKVKQVINQPPVV